jgi:DNA helicase II / ATP-dependent DNA helicase PcrA
MTNKFKPSDWAGLSDQQLEVIRWVYEGKGSLELLARAGCGKTFTLMKVVDAVVKGHLGDVALMAYNKKIADELKAKLEAAKYDWRTAQAGTVHSFGFGAWRKVAPGVQIDDKKLFSIISEQGYQKDGAFYVENSAAIAKLCSLAKQRAIGHLGAIENVDLWLDIWDHFDLDNDVTENVDPYEVVRAAQNVYKISLRQCREVIDFDDMILAPLYFRARFWPKDWVLLDESQDTNPARRALALAMLKPKTGRMIFVGDPCQAIYGFTGADSDSMNQLKVATGAKTLPLNVTRRCPKAVVEVAKRLVPDFIAHESAPQGVVRATTYDALATENLGKEDAILCRNTAPLVQTAYSLIAKGIACRVEGREIGNGLIKLARRWKLKTLDKLLAKLEDYQARQTAKFMSKGQEERVQGLVDQVDCLRIIIDRCLAVKKHSIDDLVKDIESMFGNTPDGQQPAVLTLSTGHKSKGREFARVYLLDMQKYCPSPYAKKPWQLEQEKNLEYVMITRAMRELIYVTTNN